MRCSGRNTVGIWRGPVAAGCSIRSTALPRTCSACRCSARWCHCSSTVRRCSAASVWRPCGRPPTRRGASAAACTRDGGRARRVRVARAARRCARAGGPHERQGERPGRRRGPWRLSELARATGRIRLVGDCVQYALVCRGILDAAIDPLMKPWDIGALAICVREAGGSVSDLNGEERALVQRRSLVAASSPAAARDLCTGRDAAPEAALKLSTPGAVPDAAGATRLRAHRRAPARAHWTPRKGPR